MVFEYDRFYFWYRPTDRSVVCGLCGLPNRHFELFIGGITPHDSTCTYGNESKVNGGHDGFQPKSLFGSFLTVCPAAINGMWLNFSPDDYDLVCFPCLRTKPMTSQGR